MRGQLEFIAVLGVIVVIVVVAFYALQTGIIPSVPASPDVRLVQDSTNNFIRNAAYDTLRKVSDNGGYLEPQASGAVFMGRSVPYWAREGQLVAPNVQQNIITGITSYITSNRDSFASSLSGKTVTFGQPQVSVSVLESQLSITVYMPTTVNGAQVPQPYVVSVPTKIGEVIDFSKTLAQNQMQNRYLEYFLISSILLSPYDGASQVIPTHIFLTTCGEFVFKSWLDVKPHMEETIRTTLAHTYMPDKYPTGVEHTSYYLKYAIPELSGKKHFDLNVSFDVPDGFSLNFANFQMDPNPVTAIATPIPLVGGCQSDSVNVKYYLNFPAIARVKDPLTGNIMAFAIDTYIADNTPGSWGAGGLSPSVQALICQNPTCNANITARDLAGNPIQGAQISYMGCPAGQTGSDGVFAGKVPCGFGPLNAYKGGYDVYSQYVSSDGVTAIEITMKGMPTMNVHLYEAVVDTLSGSFLQNGSYYIIPAGGLGQNNLPGVNPLNSFPERPVLAYLTFMNITNKQFYERFFDGRISTLNGIPSGSYMVGGGLTNPAMTELYGTFATGFEVRDDMDGKDIYIYFPYSYSYSQLTDKNKSIDGGALLTGMLQQCGIGPIMEGQEYDTARLPCNKNFEAL